MDSDGLLQHGQRKTRKRNTFTASRPLKSHTGPAVGTLSVAHLRPATRNRASSRDVAQVAHTSYSGLTLMAAASAALSSDYANVTRTRTHHS